MTGGERKAHIAGDSSTGYGSQATTPRQARELVRSPFLAAQHDNAEQDDEQETGNSADDDSAIHSILPIILCVLATREGRALKTTCPPAYAPAGKSFGLGISAEAAATQPRPGQGDEGSGENGDLDRETHGVLPCGDAFGPNRLVRAPRRCLSQVTNNQSTICSSAWGGVSLDCWSRDASAQFFIGPGRPCRA